MVYFAGTILFCIFAATLNKKYSMIVGRKEEIAVLYVKKLSPLGWLN